MKLAELKQYIHYKAYNKEQEEELINLIKPYIRKYPINITGDPQYGHFGFSSIFNFILFIVSSIEEESLYLLSKYSNMFGYSYNLFILL